MILQKDPNSYCEKNWMAIIDMPWHYVKWSNPTEVVKVDPITGKSTTTHLTDMVSIPRDVRGGSHVIPMDFGQAEMKTIIFALTHEVDLFDSEVGRKDGLYKHRFLVWNKEWQCCAFSQDFSFMDAHVEFCMVCVTIKRFIDDALDSKIMLRIYYESLLKL